MMSLKRDWNSVQLMFDKLTPPELPDFMWAHDPNVLLKMIIQATKKS